ncbi:hypothetical protein PAXINDRAFT_72718 [Paxillus involutus ATCC 200175]|nr:hypothetical protein PAXINDRAFT_72718 [Paxillus involutus ATCC 200175]
MYKIFPIQPPAAPCTIAAYKALRLISLQTDPASFISTYAREVAFTDDVWQQRLSSPFKQTFIASYHPAPYSDGEPQAVNEEHEDDGKDTWIGTVTILGPSELLPSTLAPFDEVGMGANWEMYFVAAMWVQPAHRGKGVGRELVMASLEWARTNVDPKFLDEKEGKEKVALLLVYDSNASGRALYSKMGFRDLVGVPVEDGQRCMSVKV